MRQLNFNFASITTPSLTIAFDHDGEDTFDNLLISRFHFARPYFLKSDFKHLRSLGPRFKLDTPGGRLKLALEYYCAEAYAWPSDRRKACGLAANPRVKYFVTDPQDIRENGINQISCGYSIDHPRFERVFGPTFAITLRQLSKAISEKKTEAIVFPIARASYAITPIRDGTRFRFLVQGFSAFEEAEQSTLDRTVKFLEQRLILQTSRLTCH
jgi:hypothetical protein